MPLQSYDNMSYTFCFCFFLYKMKSEHDLNALQSQEHCLKGQMGVQLGGSAVSLCYQFWCVCEHKCQQTDFIRRNSEESVEKPVLFTKHRFKKLQRN